MELVSRRMRTDIRRTGKSEKTNIFSKHVLSDSIIVRAVTIVLSALVATISPSSGPSLFCIKAAIAEIPKSNEKNSELERAKKLIASNDPKSAQDLAKKFEQDGNLDYAMEIYNLLGNKEKAKEINDRIITILSDYYKSKGDYYSAGLGYSKLYIGYTASNQNDVKQFRQKILEMAKKCEEEKYLFESGMLYLKIGEMAQAGRIASGLGERAEENGNLVFAILLYSDLEDARASEFKNLLIGRLTDKGIAVDLGSDQSVQMAFAQYFKINGNPYEAGLRFAEAYRLGYDNARKDALEMADQCEKNRDYFYAGDILSRINKRDNPKNPEISKRIRKLAELAERDNLGTARKLYDVLDDLNKKNEMCLRIMAEAAKKPVKLPQTKAPITGKIAPKAGPVNFQVTRTSVISATDLNPENWLSAGIEYSQLQLTMPYNQVFQSLFVKPELQVKFFNGKTVSIYLTAAYEYERAAVDSPDNAFHATHSNHAGLAGGRITLNSGYGIFTGQVRAGFGGLDNTPSFHGDAQLAYISPKDYFTLIASGNLNPYMPSGLTLAGNMPIRWIKGQRIIIELSGTTSAIAAENPYSKTVAKGRTEGIIADFLMPIYYYTRGKNPHYYFGSWIRPQAEFVQAPGFTGKIYDLTLGLFAKIGPAQLMAGYSFGANMANLSISFLGDWNHNALRISTGSNANWHGIARSTWERDVILKAGLR